jgi:hypothetical protein
MTGEATAGWAFLVARGRQLGYQLLLAPDFLAASRQSALLMDEVRGEVPAQGPPVVSDLDGQVCAVYRTLRVTSQDIGAADRPAEPLLDRAGRPLVLTYGFVCRGVRVTGPDEDDLRVARDAALATYRRFRAAEEAFVTRTSYPYSLRSAVAPAATTAAREYPAAGYPAGGHPGSGHPGTGHPGTGHPVAARAPLAAGPGLTPVPARASSVPAPWTAQAWSGGRPPAPIRRRPAIVAVLIAMLVLAGLASGGYVLRHEQRPAAPVRQVEVPNVVGQPEPAAVRLLRAAGLVAGIKPTVSQRPAGIVIGTWPRAGTRVRSHTLVRVEMSGTAARPG